MSIPDGRELVRNHAYARNHAFARKGGPHELWTRVRAEAPVHHAHTSGFEPFQAVARHADACEPSKQPERFLPVPYRIQPGI